MSHLFASGFDCGRPPAEAPLAARPDFIPSREDKIAALRLDLLRCWQRPRSLVAPAPLAACAALIGTFGPHEPGSLLAALPFGPCFGTVAATLAAFVSCRLGFYAAMPLWLGPIDPSRVDCPRRIERRRSGLRSVTPFYDARSAWSERTRWAADERVLLLYTDGRMSHAIPTRVVDAAFVATFRALAAPLRRR